MKSLIFLVSLLILPSVLAQQPNPIVMGRNTNDTLQRTLWNFRLNSSNLVDGINSTTPIPFNYRAGGTGATNFTTTGVVFADGTILTNKADFVYDKAERQLGLSNVITTNIVVQERISAKEAIISGVTNSSGSQILGLHDLNFEVSGANPWPAIEYNSNGIIASINYVSTDERFTVQVPNNALAVTISSNTVNVPFLTMTSDCWGDSQAPALSFKTDATAPSFLAFGPSGNLLCYTFAAAGTDDQVYFTVQLDHDYAEGTDIYWHVHWAETATTGAGTNVIWGLETSWANVTGTYGAPTTNYVTNAVSGTNWKHSISSFPAASGLNKTVSSIIVCRLFRLASSAADNYDQPAAVMSVDAHYRKDTIGSRNESSK